jgi:hypothetical protein
MFFRREVPQQVTFADRVANLKTLGFEILPEIRGATIAKRNGCGATLTDAGDGKVAIGKSGVLIGSDIAQLVHGGYQMFLRTEDGREIPAQADQLTALHAFDEDLREGLGLTSLYNVSLGTRCDDHLYDRVKNRDRATAPRPWEKKPAHT